MALVHPSTGDARQDRQNADFDRRLRAIEAAIQSMSAGSGTTSTVTTQVFQVFNVGETGGAEVSATEIMFEADAFVVTALGTGVKVELEYGSSPANTAEAAAAGTSEAVARADHAHALRVPLKTSDPGSPAAGTLWYRTDTDELKIYTGSATKKSAAFT